MRCWSIEWAPLKNCDMYSYPNWRLRGNIPIALVTLYLPPTQSQNPKTYSPAIPNLLVSTKLVDTAVKWADNILFSSSWPNNLYWSKIHCLHALAFIMVSAVVNVLELITNKVSSTFNPYNALRVSTGSTLAKNRNCLPLEFKRP